MSNFFGGNFGGVGGVGVGYSQQQPQNVVMNQTLTKEEIDLLRKKGPKFNFKLSKEEFLRAICTHKDPATGNISLAPNQDGTCTCHICQETFTLLSPDKFDRGAIEDICANFNDLFQSIKTMYGPIPAESGRELYTMIGFVPKLADLYEIAAEYFTKLGGSNQFVQENRSPYTMGMLNAMMGGGAGAYPGMNMNSFNPAADPNQAAAWFAQNQGQQQQQGQGQQGQRGTIVNPYTPGTTPNPAYMPSNQNNSMNPIGYVEEQQTVQPPGPADIRTAFKG